MCASDEVDPNQKLVKMEGKGGTEMNGLYKHRFTTFEPPNYNKNNERIITKKQKQNESL